MLSYFENLHLKYRKIKEHLVDEESVKLFDARVEYTLSGEWEKVEAIFFDKTKKWYCKELKKFLHKFSEKKDIVLFGAGMLGKKTKQYLDICGYRTVCFCDNNLALKTIEGIPVVSVEEFLADYKDSVIIICSYNYREEMYQQLIIKGYSAEKILLPGANRIQIHCGKQYFDLFQPKKGGEIFIDAGSFDGSSTVDFFSWLQESGESGKCYALEPVPEMYDKIVERSRKEKWKDVTICNCAAWDKKEVICLIKDQKENGVIWGGSYIGESGGMKANGEAIDSILNKEEVITYIKMDIEGSELKALEGAKNTIMRYKPRLAISIYHKPWDIFEIPDYNLSLVPEYRLYIRHYSADCTETVLYAEI